MIFDSGENQTPFIARGGTAGGRQVDGRWTAGWVDKGGPTAVVLWGERA